MADRLGLRQVHVTPALAENVVPVIVLDDIREPRQEPRRTASLTVNPSVGDGLTLKSQASLRNDITSGIVLHLRRVEFWAPGNTPAADVRLAYVPAITGLPPGLVEQGFTMIDTGDAVGAGDKKHGIPAAGRTASALAFPIWGALVENFITNHAVLDASERPIVIRPGQAVILGLEILTNLLNSVTFTWDEERL